MWLARSVTGSWRAVKVVHRDRFRDGRPFEREWAGVRRFEELSREHDAFVDILQTGRGEGDAFFYYVMELADDARGPRGGAGLGPSGGDAEGYAPRTLSAVLRESGRLSPADCLRMGERLASGLVRLHDAGLLHRDVKPSNIIFVGGEARLADIGLVTDVAEARSYVGTDGFIPVEGPNSPQADVFGLGKVLYEAMTGLDRMEFPRVPSGLGAGPDGRVLLELNAVVLRACAASQSMRHGNARELADDLSKVAAGRSVRRGARSGPGAGGMGWMAWGAACVAVLVGLAVAMGGPWAGWGRRGGGASVSPVAGAAAGGAGASGSMGRPDRRLGTLEGLRLWEDGDAAGALLVLAEMLGGAREDAEALGDRVRVGQVLAGMPREEATWDCGAGLLSVVFSPDASRLATGHRDGVVQVWDVARGARVGGPWKVGEHGVRVGVSPDGRHLLVAPPVNQPAVRGTAGHGTARWLDAATGASLPGGLDHVLWAVFNGDGRWVAGVRGSNEVVVAEGPGAGTVRVLGRHAKAVEGLAFSVDGQRVASVSDDGTARVWSVTTGREVCPPLRLPGAGLGVALGGAGGSLWVLSLVSPDQSVLQEWDLDGGGRLVGERRLEGIFLGLEPRGGGHEGIVAGSFRSGLRMALAGDAKGAADRWISFGGTRCLAWAISPDGAWAVGGGEDGRWRAWELGTCREAGGFPMHARQASALAFAPDGRRVALGSEDGLIRVWSGWGGAEGTSREVAGVVWGRDGHGLRALPAAMDPSGRSWVALAMRRGRAVVVGMSVDPGEGPWFSEVPEGIDPNALAMASDGGSWMVHDADMGLRQAARPWDAWMGGRPAPTWSGQVLPHPMACKRAGFDATVGAWVTLDDTGHWRCWDARTGAAGDAGRVQVPPGVATDLSSDGQWVAAMDADGFRIHFRERARGAGPVASWRAPERVHGMRFLGGTNWLLVEDVHRHRWLVDGAKARPIPIPPGSLDGGRVPGWHAPTGRLLHVLESAAVEVVDAREGEVRRWPRLAGDKGVRDAVLSPDGRWVAVVDPGDGVRVMEAMSGEPVSRRWMPGGRVRWMGWTAEPGLVVLTDPNRIHTWAMQPYAGTADGLRERAMALSGRRRDPQGGLEWLGPAALARKASEARGR